MMLSIFDKTSLNNWLNNWKVIGNKEPFCHPFFCEMFCNKFSEPVSFFWKDDDGQIMLPLIKRNINHDLELDIGVTLYDLTSPYGYGGPFFIGNPNWFKFWASMIDWARHMNIVSCFIRFSLLVPEVSISMIPIKIKNKNIIRNLNIKEDQLWYDYAHKVRKNVKRALNNNIVVTVDAEGITLNKFIDIYYHTMERRRAKEDYYFKEDFFENLIFQMKENCLLFNAIYKDDIISTELVLLSNENIYSFLGGTKEEYFELRPNDLLKHEIIIWGIRNNMKNYILGGGYSGEDGIYLYKKSFAPRGEIAFRTGEIIINDVYYNELVKVRSERATKKGTKWIPKENYFPIYRG